LDFWGEERREKGKRSEREKEEEWRRGQREGRDEEGKGNSKREGRNFVQL